MLVLNNISKIYDKKRVVNNASFKVEDGEFFFILGPSGCGKTTLLKIISGIINPTEGEVEVNGVNITSVPPNKRMIHSVFQDYALFPHMTVFENIGFTLKIKKKSNQLIIDRVKEMLKMVNLGGYENRRINQLSGGEQQRVAIARALINNPNLLLLDEPTSALDNVFKRQVLSDLERIKNESKASFIYVTHDQKEAIRLADRIAIMKDGEIVQIGSPEEIYTHPKNRFVAKFLGDINFVSTSRREAEILFCSQKIHVNSKYENFNSHLTNPVIGIRPENISLIKNEISNHRSNGLTNFVEAIIKKIEFNGDHTLIVSELKDGQLITIKDISNAIEKIKINCPIGLSWSKENTLAFYDD